MMGKKSPPTYGTQCGVCFLDFLINIYTLYVLICSFIYIMYNILGLLLTQFRLE